MSGSEHRRDLRLVHHPQRVDRFWEREQQAVTQRMLLERLRHKGYVRRGTLSHFMQWLGDIGRKYFAAVRLLRVRLR